jgi:hypothetical protein
VSTGANEVVDAFYVRDRTTGGKVTDGARIDAIAETVRTAIATDVTDR